MYYPRHYRCLACGEKFTRSDGVICLPSDGVPCSHCGSKKTKERTLGGVVDLFGLLVRVFRKKMVKNESYKKVAVRDMKKWDNILPFQEKTLSLLPQS